MEGQGLVVSYHERSRLGLQRDEEDDLAQILRETVPEVRVEEFKPGLPPASILDEIRLILVLGGALAAKVALEHIVVDLYSFFKRRLSSIKDRKPSPDYGVLLLDLKCENGWYYVAADFRDEDTLALAFYQLYSYVQKTPPLPSRSELVEFETPPKPRRPEPPRPSRWRKRHYESRKSEYETSIREYERYEDTYNALLERAKRWDLELGRLRDRIDQELREMDQGNSYRREEE